MTADRPLLGVRSILDESAPAERLAAFRITTGVFVMSYLLIRLPVFLDLAQRETDSFQAVGIASVFGGPVAPLAVRALVAGALLSGMAATVGWRYRVVGPVFAISVLMLTTYRSSWGQLLHFENLFVLHLIVLSLAPAADVWSLDASRKRASGTAPISSPYSSSYGWPLGLACMCVVTSYFIAGVAKLRYGGTDWAFSDTLRNHVAYSAVRLDLLGGRPSPIASSLVRHAWIFPPLAIASIIVELAAPITLFVARTRRAWVVCAWVMHVSIFASMLVGFPYPLFLAAFAPFFPIERIARRDWVRRVRRKLLLPTSP